MNVCVCECVYVYVSVCVHASASARTSARDGFADLGFYHPVEPAAFRRCALAAGTRGDGQEKLRAVHWVPPGSSGPERGQDGACARGPDGPARAPAAGGRAERSDLASGGGGWGDGRGRDPRAPRVRESPSFLCLPPQTMDLHGGRRLGARPPAEEPSPPAC